MPSAAAAVALVVVIDLAIGVALLYNRLVRDRNRVDAAWSDIDVRLQRRHDLIPQLVKPVGRYARYERATIDAVNALRTESMKRTDVVCPGETEEQLSRGVRRLLALAEQYPDLKASNNLLDLQEELVETENYLQFARRFYDGTVRAFNTRTQTVPDNIVTGWFRFRERSFFRKSSDEAAAVPLAGFGSVE